LDWCKNRLVLIYQKTSVNKGLGELLFWLNRVQAINIRELASYSRSSVIIYSDASSVAAGAHTVELDSKVFHTNWSENEKSNSSTWREMRAREREL
jgi:hypothetical protein